MSVGVITIDGTKIKANASMDQNRSYRDLVGQILREAEETDQAEDRLHGKDRRAMSCPRSCAPRRVAARRWRRRSAGWRSARAGRSRSARSRIPR